MVATYRDYSELQKFTEAQTQIILDLQNKLRFIEEKNNSLERIIDSSGIPSLNVTIVPVTNQELIAREQLVLIKANSTSRELTYEECKKVSEYTKILKDIESNNKNIPSTARRLSTNELLSNLSDINE